MHRARPEIAKGQQNVVSTHRRGHERAYTLIRLCQLSPEQSAEHRRQSLLRNTTNGGCVS